MIRYYKIVKNHYGWMAESFVRLEGDRFVSITTMKRHNGTLSTTATVGNYNNGIFSYDITQDFRETLTFSRPARVTKKVVEEQHANVNLDSLLERARDYYQQVA